MTSQAVLFAEPAMAETGPLGSEKFVMTLESILNRMLKPKKAGRPKPATAQRRLNNTFGVSIKVR